jgi:pilus assembly protein FimV
MDIDVDSTDYVSVDNLIDDLAEGDDVELPDDLDIDVGLDDFEELADSRGTVDVDQESGGFANQLDLARTYIDMDDEENARLIINEVLEGGNDEAKAQANALLAELDK